MRKSNQSLEQGFTIIELMLAVTVMGILLAIGIPSFTEFVRNNQMVAQTNQFIGGLSYARSESIRSAAVVTLCPTTTPNVTGATCSNTPNWETGFIAFRDVNANNTREVATEEIVQAFGPAAEQITIRSTNRNYVRYLATGMNGSGLETFSILRPGCVGNKARQIAISTTGRLATSIVACP